MDTKTFNTNIGIMTTLSEVTNSLKGKGYKTDFKLVPNYLECEGNHLKIFPGEFIVDKHYRFEGASDPADEAIVFAISSSANESNIPKLFRRVQTFKRDAFIYFFVYFIKGIFP